MSDKYTYQLFKDLMDHIPDVIYFKDKKGRLIMVNQAHARGLGLKPEQVAGKTDFDIFSKERAEKMLQDDLRVIRSGKPIIDKVERATRADGVDNYVSTTKIPRYNDKGEIIGLIGITRDITHRMQLKHLQDEKEHIKKKLEALQDVNKLKSDFVSAVSHELRTPLAITKEAISLIFDGLAGPLTGKQKEFLTKANNNIIRLQHIIDELLDISRIETGRLELHYSLVNLNDLIIDSSEFFKKLAQDKGVRMQYQLPKNEINVFIDVDRIMQVINNLISNAIKFTEEGGSIKIEVKLLENKVRLGVIDTGIGIAKGDLPKLFHKFVQVSKTPIAQKKGLGLGLSIARELIDKHGGEIWVESKLGVGSKFYFTLLRVLAINILNKDIRDKINGLLKEGKTAYLINLSIFNLPEIKNKIKPKQLAEDLESIVKASFKDFQVVYMNRKKDEYGIILPGATEERVARIYELLKEKINNYFRQNKLENIFINIGKFSYPHRKSPEAIQQVIGTLHIQKIYIGLDKRHFKRAYYKLDIEVISRGAATEPSQTIDISAGGICFLSSKQLDTDREVKIRLKAPRTNKPLALKARVAWIRPMEDRAGRIDKYRVGIEFLKLESKNKKILQNLLK